MAAPAYVHEEYTHDLSSPREIVPVLLELFHPASVVDVGCGIGTFLYCLKEGGVDEVLGIDGPWTNRQLVSKYLADNEFREANLSEEIKLEKQFDLALCLEVGEHLAERASENLVKTLCGLSKRIVFSAAIPGQGGQNHINEQWTAYWQGKFAKFGYRFLDVFRPYFWDNSKIHWWYRQNIFLVIHESVEFNGSALRKASDGKIMNLIHPELFRLKDERLNQLMSGRSPLRDYLRLIAKKFLKK